MHPFLTLAKAYLDGHITLTEYRTRAELFRLDDPPRLFEYGAFGQETGTPTSYLAPLLRELAHLSASEPNEDRLTTLAEIVSRLSFQHPDATGMTPHSAYRRIYGVLYEQSEITSLHHTDLILLALGTILGEEWVPLPFLSLTRKGAEEQIDSYLDAKGKSMNELARKQLAKKLHRFNVGFANGGRLTGDHRALTREVRLQREYDARKNREATPQPA